MVGRREKKSTSSLFLGTRRDGLRKGNRSVKRSVKGGNRSVLGCPGREKRGRLPPSWLDNLMEKSNSSGEEEGLK